MGDHCSVPLGDCEAVPASANVDFRGRVAEVCSVGDRLATTHVRDRISQATTTVVPIQDPSWGSHVSAMESPRPVGEIVAVSHRLPELDSGTDGVVSSCGTESLFGASDASGEERARSTSANFDFGQFKFDQFDLGHF